MSRCASTRRLLDAVFTDVGLTRDQAEHVASCAECARAFALQRRFDAGLESVGRDLATERVGSVHDLIGVSNQKGRSAVSWRNGFIGAAAVAVILLAVTVASVLGDGSLGSDVGRVFGLALDRSEAAQAFGIPADAVVMVGGDAVGLRVLEEGDSASFELLLMEAEEREVRNLYQHRIDIPPDSGGIFTQPVRCAGLLERDLYAIMGMGWPSPRARAHAVVSGVSGETAVFETMTDRAAVLFVAEGDAVDRDTVYRLRVGGGESTGPLEDTAVNCAQPATATCGEWGNWAVGTQASITKWLTEARFAEVRISQQLPADASEAEVVSAAVSSIDKNCEMSPAGMRLTEIVEQLYD